MRLGGHGIRQNRYVPLPGLEMHDFPTPAGEADDIVEGGNGILVTIRCVHPPPKIGSIGKRKKR
jgi:hypothetical protein